MISNFKLKNNATIPTAVCWLLCPLVMISAWALIIVALVHSFSIPIGLTLSDAGIIQVGITPTWTYNAPVAVSSGTTAAPAKISTPTVKVKGGGK